MTALPWVLREKLRVLLRPRVQGTQELAWFAEVVATEVSEVAGGPGGAPLRKALKDGLGRKKVSTLARSWFAELPATRRSDWLVDRLASAAGFTWDAEPTADDAPVRIRVAERDRIMRRFVELQEELLDRHDDDPEPEEYADLIQEELERIAGKNAALAHRLTTRRFPGRSYPNTSITLRALLDIEQISDPEELVRFVSEKLGIEWS